MDLRRPVCRESLICWRAVILSLSGICRRRCTRYWEKDQATRLLSRPTPRRRPRVRPRRHGITVTSVDRGRSCGALGATAGCELSGRRRRVQSVSSERGAVGSRRRHLHRSRHAARRVERDGGGVIGQLQQRAAWRLDGQTPRRSRASARGALLASGRGRVESDGGCQRRAQLPDSGGRVRTLVGGVRHAPRDPVCWNHGWSGDSPFSLRLSGGHRLGWPHRQLSLG